MRVRLRDKCPVYEESQRAYSCNQTLFYAPMRANVAEAYSTSLRVTMTEILARHPSPGRDRSEDLYFGVLSFPVESHIIYYREVPTGIEVLAVLHQTQDSHNHL
ncbi:type II toxin-antitoxin system RelE/ParE family toxin [Photorhabdus hindustanensis]|uniref:type II toxin-antitoxin system RelE/ParE family toxin n=1 Tax=Photorhabdus hindustanensis TaxID=2918802 RepID=UPI0030DD2823